MLPIVVLVFAQLFAPSAVSAGSSWFDQIHGLFPREQVLATTQFPYRTIGRTANGCTGTLIGPRHVLTAGHCVYDIRKGVWSGALDFTPGQNGGERPFGTIAWERALTVSGWTEDHNEEFDYAMIILTEAVGNRLGWMGFGYNNYLSTGTPLEMAGYAGDKPTGTLWKSICPIEGISNGQYFHRCDSAPGNSGSALFYHDVPAGKRVIYGIHAYGGEKNQATRLDEAKYRRITAWIAEHP